jgi:drug/metabolite transporter (DMT)-like permease
MVMIPKHDAPRDTPAGLVIVAFAAIYLIWGSTYLGIRFAVETLPPFLMGGARFLSAGLILYAALRWRGTPAPGKDTWGSAILAASLLLGVGNGGVNWAERKVSSGMAALIIAGTPMWFALFDWLRPGGTRPSFQTLFGIGVGFGGVAILVGSHSTSVAGIGNVDPAGAAALVVASVAWAIGSLYTKYTVKTDSPLMSAAQQMITGGVILALTGVAAGETAGLDWAKVSARSTAAFVYLTLIGSLVGFTAYGWLLKVTTPARASTYAYVNPVVALFLGWAFGGESMTASMLVAAAVIVFGVVVITMRRAPTIRSGVEAAG